MRVHLLLILFFASTVSARCARSRRNADVTTVEPPSNSTIKVNDENKTTDVLGNGHDGDGSHQINVVHPLKIMSDLIRPILNFIKLILQDINNALSMILKGLSSLNDIIGKPMIHAMIQPFEVILKLIIGAIKRVFHLFL